MIGSNTIVEVNGQRVRGRLYPWGIVEGQYKSVLEYLHFAQDKIYIINQLDTFQTPPTLFRHSGQSVPLWFRQAEDHVDSLTHARPERHHVWRALWKLQGAVHTANDKVSHNGFSKYLTKHNTHPLSSLMKCSVFTSKLTQDNRVESPIPILPLSTPDVETEKLIKMKDEEVSSPA